MNSVCAQLNNPLLRVHFLSFLWGMSRLKLRHRLCQLNFQCVLMYLHLSGAIFKANALYLRFLPSSACGARAAATVCVDHIAVAIWHLIVRVPRERWGHRAGAGAVQSELKLCFRSYLFIYFLLLFLHQRAGVLSETGRFDRFFRVFRMPTQTRRDLSALFSWGMMSV